MTSTIEAMKQMVEALETYGDKHRKTYLLEGAWDEEITKGDAAIQAGKKAIAKLERQKPVALFYLPVRKDMREDVEALIDHAKRARWTDVVVRKDAVETTYEADWIKELIPYTPPQRTWVGLTDDEYFALQMKIKTPMISVQDYIDAMRMVEQASKEKNS